MNFILKLLWLLLIVKIISATETYEVLTTPDTSFEKNVKYSDDNSLILNESSFRDTTFNGEESTSENYIFESTSEAFTTSETTTEDDITTTEEVETTTEEIETTTLDPGICLKS
jgi:hypothetical protein